MRTDKRDEVKVTILAVEKQKNIAYSECMSVTLGIHHTLRMHHIVISCVAVQYLSTLSCG